MTTECVLERFQLNTKRIKLRPVSSELRWNLRSSIGFARRPALELFCCGAVFRNTTLQDSFFRFGTPELYAEHCGTRHS